MRRRVKSIAAPALIGLLALFGAASAQAAAPIYDIKATWGDTNLPPGGEAQFTIQVRNVGDGTAEAAFSIVDELPPGVKVKKIEWRSFTENRNHLCTGVGTETASCLLSKAQASLLPSIAEAPGLKASGVAYRPDETGYVWPISVEVEIEPGASGTATNTATVAGGGAEEATDVDQVTFSSTPAPFEIVPGSFQTDVFAEAYPGKETSRQAGDHPFEQRYDFDITAESRVSANDGTRMSAPSGSLRTVLATLPRGMVGNPQALPKCDPLVFVKTGSAPNGTGCPANTQVGYLNVLNYGGAKNHGNGGLRNATELLSRVPIYNLEPPAGTPVDLAFNAFGLVQTHIFAILDPAQNYAIKALTPSISSAAGILGSQVTIWGVPGDPAHDKFRFYPQVTAGNALGAPFTAPIEPFFTNPSDCGFDNGGHRIRVDSYQEPGKYTPVVEYPDPLNVTDCDDPRFRFEPKTSLQPSSKEAGAPVGLDVHLEIPQRDGVVDEAKKLYAENGNVKGISTPPMKKVVVKFPEGMTVNPSAAQGLGSCSPEQIGLGTDSPVTCPDSSQYGTLTLHTPALPIDNQPEGFLYVAKQNDNPFHNFLSLYLVIQEPETGILVKLAGKVDLDPKTGQITSTFDDLPQFPVSDIEMNLKGGLRAGLVNPQTCGKKTIVATFYSWHDPQTPHTVNSNYEISKNQDGSPCLSSPSERPFNPVLSGGTHNNLAGSFSPLELRMTRSDLEQELSGVEGTAPKGLLASLRGLSRCTDAAIAAASVEGRSGMEEQNNPSCPASSLVGTVDAGAGVGQVITYVHGKVYLAGPYKGAPLSGVAIVPVVAGPFDLGVIVSRAPAYADPRTAEVRLVTDPLPLIFKGIPVRVRDIQVHLDRPNFILNPTNCDPLSLSGTLFSSEGKSKTSGSPFQVAECASLGFKPRLTAHLFGGTKRGAHPKFRALFRAREGDANVSGAVVTLPRSAFLDQSHIRTVCTRVQFKADACPQTAIYGHAEARTPLLEQPLRGPVYLRSSDNKLPDIVADLNGEIPVEVVGRVDSVRGGIRTTFEQVPDAPVESFAIAMQGGKKGLLVNSRDICARAYRLEAQFSAQNGKEATLRPKLQATCRGRKAKAQR